MNGARAAQASRRGLALVAVAGTAILAWYTCGVLHGEYLRQPTVESVRLCKSLIDEGSCPDVLVLPGHDAPALDPWGEPYCCRRTEEGVLAIGSYAANGRPGGFGRHGDVECGPFRSVSTHAACSCTVTTGDDRRNATR